MTPKVTVSLAAPRGLEDSTLLSGDRLERVSGTVVMADPCVGRRGCLGQEPEHAPHTEAVLMAWEGSLCQRPGRAGASLTLCPGGLLLWEGQPFLSGRSEGPEALCHLKGGRDYLPLGFWASFAACPRAPDRFPPPPPRAPRPARGS